MQRAMDAVRAELWQARQEDLPLDSPEEVLTLASSIEKETGVDSERALVASVFVNRLRKGMPLQSDPTVVYGITEGKAPLGRALTRKDLKQPTAYNTYQIAGLPTEIGRAPCREGGWQYGEISGAAVQLKKKKNK